MINGLSHGAPKTKRTWNIFHDIRNNYYCLREKIILSLLLFFYEACIFLFLFDPTHTIQWNCWLRKNIFGQSIMINSFAYCGTCLMGRTYTHLLLLRYLHIQCDSLCILNPLFFFNDAIVRNLFFRISRCFSTTF